MPAGRPTKYEDWMPEKVIELMREGASKTQVAAALGICKDTLYEWIDSEGDYFIPEFSDALKQGMTLSQAWWEKQAKEGIWAGKQFNATTFIFMMKNMFREDYGDNPPPQNQAAPGFTVEPDKPE